jgi:hypothetical protein
VATVDEVRAIALRLPDAYEQPSYGDRPSWRTKPRVFAWLREDPEALVVWVSSVEEKDAMVAAEPHLFTTPHYDGLPIVLVDLDTVAHDELEELITESWRLRAPRRAVAALDADRTT